MKSLLINALIWEWRTYPHDKNQFTPMGDVRKGSIVLSDGVIEKILEDGDTVDHNDFDNVVDVKENLVTPGLIGDSFMNFLVFFDKVFSL
jgi:imidazolonepropionase-like amidohydrolase